MQINQWGPSEFPDLTYEEGVEAALTWVLDSDTEYNKFGALKSSHAVEAVKRTENAQAKRATVQATKRELRSKQLAAHAKGIQRAKEKRLAEEAKTGYER